MINLPVDEAYVFDYYAILQIKGERFKNQADNLLIVEKSIIKQIGKKLFYDILISDEYHDLKNANIITFDAVDKAKYNLVTAKVVDDCNNLRYKAKQKLQKKFFNNNIKEYKN
jgi:ribosomal protein L21